MSKKKSISNDLLIDDDLGEIIGGPLIPNNFVSEGENHLKDRENIDKSNKKVSKKRKKSQTEELENDDLGEIIGGSSIPEPQPQKDGGENKTKKQKTKRSPGM